MRLRHAGVECYGLFQLCQRPVVFAACQINPAQGKTSNSVVRVQPARVFCQLQRLVEQLRHFRGLEIDCRDHQRIGQPCIGGCEIRVKFDGAAKIALCIGIGIGAEFVLDRQAPVVAVPCGHGANVHVAGRVARQPLQFRVQRRGNGI